MNDNRLLRDRYNIILDEFENKYPTIAEQAASWYAIGPYDIVIVLIDNSKIIFYSEKGTIQILNDNSNNTDNHDLFGNKLYAKLVCSGMSQRELAKRSGLSPMTISRYINNIQTPSIKAIQKISKVFGCTEYELLYK